MLTKLKILLPLLLLLVGFGSHSFGQCGSVDFKIDKNSGCSPLGVTFVAENVPSGAKIEWNLGGGFFNGTDTVFRFFTNPGKEDITLRITPQGASSPCTTLVKRDAVEVFAKPDINLYISDSILCEGPAQVTFIDSTSNVSSREWIYDGNVQPSSTGSTMVQQATMGTHSVSLEVTNSSGCSDLLKKQDAVVVYEDRTVEICGNIRQNDSQMVANFNANTISGTGQIQSYDWTFQGGDTSKSSASNPRNIVYDDLSKTYDVELVVTYAGGCSYTTKTEDYIAKSLSVSDDSVCLGETITVTNLAPGNGRSDLSMSFPGANFESGQINSQFGLSYSTTGSKLISYSYKYNSANNACFTTVRAPGIITVEGPQARVFSSDKTDCNLDSIQIRSTSRLPQGGNNTYTWAFFDADSNHVQGSPLSPSTQNDEIKFKFDSNGVYSAYLKVENSKNGCVDSIFEKDYLRLIAPTASLVDGDSVYCADENLEIEASADPPATPSNPYTYIWKVNHDDSTNIRFTGSGKRFVRNVTMPGTYSVNLVIKSSNDCADTLDKDSFIVVNGVVGNARVDSTKGCQGLSANLTSNVRLNLPSNSTSNLTYLWESTPSVGVNIADSSLASTSATFDSIGCHSISLKIENSAGCIKNLSASSVCVGVIANWGFDQDTLDNLCLNQSMPLVDSSRLQPTEYKWKVDRAGVTFIPNDTVPMPRISFSRSDSFLITQITRTDEGCVDSISRWMFISATEADFSVDKPLSLCAPQAVKFTNNSKNATKYEWIYDDGSSSTNANTEHTYVYTTNNISGFTPKLVAFKSDQSSCTDTFELTSRVRIIGPTPEFSLDTALGCDSQLVSYSNLTDPINAEFAFDYGDGSAPDSNVINDHTYYFPTGNTEDSVAFFPTIVATSFGCDAFYTDTVVIYRTPTADFEIDTNFGCRPLTVNFFNTSTSARTTEWDLFADGDVDTAQIDTFTYTFDTTGYFDMKLTNTLGICQSIFTKDSIVGVDDPPFSFFSLSDSIFCDSQTVTFTNLTNPNNATTIIDYGDSSAPDTNFFGRHTYRFIDTTSADSIAYFPTLTAISAGCQSSYTDTVIVYRSPELAFAEDTSLGCKPLQVNFVNQSQHYDTIQWDLFNDNQIDSALGGAIDSFKTTLDTVGFFGVRISASLGICSESLLRDSLVDVRDIPRADFSISDQDICDSLEVTFNENAFPSDAFFFFDYGNSSAQDTDRIALREYLFPDTASGDSFIYRPTMVVNSGGCLDTLTDTIITYKTPTASFAVDTTFGCNPVSVTFTNTSSAQYNVRWDIFNDGSTDTFAVDTFTSVFDSVMYVDVAMSERVGPCIDTFSLDSVIRVFRVPEANLSYSTQRGCDSALISFTSTNTALDSFFVDYGLGSLDTNSLNDQKYQLPQAPGDSFRFYQTLYAFNIELAACSDTLRDSVTIYRTPTAGFSVDTQRGCAPLNLTFNDTSSLASEYHWDFDEDGVQDDSVATPEFEFTDGLFDVRLIINTPFDCPDTLLKSNYITAYKAPEVRIGASNDSSCRNTAVTFSDLSQLDTTIASRTWDFGRPVGADSSNLTFVDIAYNNIGSYWVTLEVVDSTNCSGTDSLEFFVIDNVAPERPAFDSLIASAGTKEIQWLQNVGGDFERYEIIRVNNRDSLLITRLEDSTDLEYTDNSAGLARYYLRTTDSCSNTSTLSAPIYSIALQAENVGNNLIRVSWRHLSPGNFASFELWRGDENGTNFSQIATLAPNELAYVDSTACDSTVSYFVTGNAALSGSKSISNSVSVKSNFVRQNEALELYRASVLNDEVVSLSWSANDQQDHDYYVIDRKVENANWQIAYDSTEQLSLIDSAVMVDSLSYQYRVYARDICDFRNPLSNLGTSIKLSAETELGNVSTQWNAYEGWKSRLRYQIQVRNGENGSFRTLAEFNADTLSFVDENLYEGLDTPWCYRVLAIKQGAQIDTSVSNVDCDYLSYELFVPNAFTPNGDGLNETFAISGEAILRNDNEAFEYFNLSIYDRWGAVLFKTDQPGTAWDGSKNGQSLPIGKYFYMLKAKSVTGKEFDLKGPVFILK